jgi:hypothetical protein
MFSQEPKSSDIKILHRDEIYTAKENEIIRIETLSSSSMKDWTYTFFQNGGEIQGPGRIISYGTQNVKDFKWHNYYKLVTKEIKDLAKATSILLFIAGLTILATDYIKEVNIYMYPLSILIALAILTVFCAIVILDEALNRINLFKYSRNSYKLKIKSQFVKIDEKSISEE